MPLDLCDFDTKTRFAIKVFWGARDAAAQAQLARGKQDAGSRGAVTSGKNMDGFLGLVKDVVSANGLPDATVHVKKGVVVLPGYFRPTKLWDVVVMRGPELIAVLEFKSQVGPSFGNNFNNRTEEAIGSGHDIMTAYREGAFGEDARKPFLGWLIHVEDCAASTKPIKTTSPHFPVMEGFENNPSYATRYDMLCRRMVQEQLYDAATLLMSPRSSRDGGDYSELSELTSIKSLVAGLAAHVATVAAV